MHRPSSPAPRGLCAAALLTGLLLLPSLPARADLNLHGIPQDFVIGQPTGRARAGVLLAPTNRSTVPAGKLAAPLTGTLFPFEASDAFFGQDGPGRGRGSRPETTPHTETSLDRLARGWFSHGVDEEDVRLDSPFDRIGEVTLIGADTETLVYVPDSLPLPAFLAPLFLVGWIRRRTRAATGSLSR